MINGLGYKLANVPTITGLATITADNVISDTTSTDQLFIDGVDVSSEVNNQKARIIVLEQKTTGITYDDTGGIDLTTIDNNLTITSGKILTVNGVDITTALTGITYDNTAGIDLTTIDNNVSITKNASALQLSVGGILNPVAGDNATILSQPSAGVFEIRNQETSGSIRFATRDATNTVANRLSLSSADLTINTTNNPTMSGYTLSAGTDNTTKISTNAWVQSAITASAGSFVTTNTVQNITANKTFNDANLTFKDTTPNDTTIKQNAITGNLEFKQGYLSGSYEFITKNAIGTNISVLISAGTITSLLHRILDTAGGLQLATHSYSGNTYSIENSSSTGIINFITNAITQFAIDSTKCSFTNPPECSVAPTTANMLCNKNYIDTNTLTLSGTQTISGQKTFTNVLNSYAGSGSSLSGVVHTTGAESIAGDKTFINGIIMSDSGTNTSTIAQYNNQFNFISNVLNNTTTTITGLIPSVNLSCIVRTDSATPVGDFGFITAGANINQTYFNNFYNGTTSITNPGITIIALTTIQSTSALSLGACIISFIGTRFALGTYITANLGSGNYTISQNALVATAVKATTSVSYTPLSRPYLAGGAAVGSITFDFNNTLNLNSLNQSSVMLNAIQIKPSLTTSTVNMFGDLSCKGQLNYNIGPLITASITLANPLAQHYPVAMASASQTITLPVPTLATVFGASITFKRRTNTTAFTLAAGAGTPFLPNSSITQAATFAFAVGIFQANFVCDGVNWCCTSIS